MLAIIRCKIFCLSVWYPLTHIEKMYAYHSHNTKYFHISLPNAKHQHCQNSNTYAYQYHNLKYTSTTTTTENMYTYKYHKKNV